MKNDTQHLFPLSSPYSREARSGRGNAYDKKPAKTYKRQDPFHSHKFRRRKFLSYFLPSNPSTAQQAKSTPGSQNNVGKRSEEDLFGLVLVCCIPLVLVGAVGGREEIDELARVQGAGNRPQHHRKTGAPSPSSRTRYVFDNSSIFAYPSSPRMKPLQIHRPVPNTPCG